MGRDITKIVKTNQEHSVNLNLTRKWRSANFEEIIGQDLSVKVLKNSLYRGHYFPVYLFSGQRGCGKTSTARVFAAAVNCEKLNLFQRKPRSAKIPCQVCASCIAMRSGKHPDFFEIDAASHTGVDTIRTIIEASNLMPLMGSKKIYLIDEAHMLSKASFNALLKILEEPPSSVLFMLATTNPDKIIDTVKSRCFQLFFKPIDSDSLVTHLKMICDKEEIVYEQQALALIVNETEGSARDAINTLEQVRFASSSVTLEAVRQALGLLSDEQMVELFGYLLAQDAPRLLQFFKQVDIVSYSAEAIWQALIELCRVGIWLKHGVEPNELPSNSVPLKKMISRYPFARINAILDALCANESLFSRMSAKHALIEIVLLQLCKSPSSDNPSGAPAVAATPTKQEKNDDEEYEIVTEEIIEEEIEDDDEDQEASGKNETNKIWDKFVFAVDGQRDPLVSSIFKQGRLQQLVPETNELHISFSQEFVFFQDWLTETKKVWKPILDKVFGKPITLKATFTDKSKRAEKSAQSPKSEILDGNIANVSVQSVATQVQKVQSSAQRAQNRSQPVVRNNVKRTPPRFSSYGTKKGKQRPAYLSEKRVDVSDTSLWPQANLLLSHFSGVITEIAKR